MALVRLENGLAICLAESERCRRETFHCEGCEEFREMVEEGRVMKIPGPESALSIEMLPSAKRLGSRTGAGLSVMVGFEPTQKRCSTS